MKREQARLIGRAVLNQRPPFEPGQRVVGRGGEQLSERLGPKPFAEDGGVLGGALLLGRKGVEAGGDCGLDGVRQAVCDIRAVSLDRTGDLLGEEGVAAAGDRNLLGEIDAGSRDQRGGQLLGSSRRQRSEVDALTAFLGGQAGAPLVDLGPRGADDQQGSRGQAGGVFDQVEETLVGPMEVFDGDQHRALVGKRGDQLAPRAANGGRVAVGVAAVEGRRQGGRGVLGARRAGPLEPSGECRPDLLGAGAAGGIRRPAKQLGQRPERDSVSVGRVAPGEWQRGGIKGAGHGDQLAYEAGLACAGLSDDQGQPGPALADRPQVGEPERLELGAPTVKRRLLRRRSDGADRVVDRSRQSPAGPRSVPEIPSRRPRVDRRTSPPGRRSPPSRRRAPGRARLPPAGALPRERVRPSPPGRFRQTWPTPRRLRSRSATRGDPARRKVGRRARGPRRRPGRDRRRGRAARRRRPSPHRRCISRPVRRALRRCGARLRRTAPATCGRPPGRVRRPASSSRRDPRTRSSPACARRRSSNRRYPQRSQWP